MTPRPLQRKGGATPVQCSCHLRHGAPGRQHDKRQAGPRQAVIMRCYPPCQHLLPTLKSATGWELSTWVLCSYIETKTNMAMGTKFIGHLWHCSSFSPQIGPPFNDPLHPRPNSNRKSEHLNGDGSYLAKASPSPGDCTVTTLF